MSFLLRLVRFSMLKFVSDAFLFAACPLLGASSFIRYFATIFCFSLYFYKSFFATKILIINYLQNIFLYFTSFRLIEELMLFLVSENGCTYAYPPPLGFCVWAFGGGLA
jgi:hypothetical protein